MAMTKAEKAEMEALRIRAALSWPPTPPVPVAACDIDRDKPFYGWWMNVHRADVGRGVVFRGLHAPHPYTLDQLENRYRGGSPVVMTQSVGGPWYHTKRGALMALHFALALQFAKELLSVERLVEAERE